MPTNDSSPVYVSFAPRGGSELRGASNFYVFKSQLQEYAQKEGLPTPEYETFKDGPSHMPSFKSTVIFNGVRYNSLPGFFNRKAAEQSAAEVALVELTKSGAATGTISQPVYETGLCKNLLQEYAQKMNYAIPMYECRREDLPGRVIHFTCTVEVGGTRYIGTAAKTKKEAEIKAARTALLAIKSSSPEQSVEQSGCTQFSVVPCKKRGIESVTSSTEAMKVSKAKNSKKGRAKKRARVLAQQQINHAQVDGNMNHDITDNSGGVLPSSDLVQKDFSRVQVTETRQSELKSVTFSQNEIDLSMGLAEPIGSQVMESRISSSDALVVQTQNDQGDSSCCEVETSGKEGVIGSLIDGNQGEQLVISNAGLGVQVTSVKGQPISSMGGEKN